MVKIISFLEEKKKITEFASKEKQNKNSQNNFSKNLAIISQEEMGILVWLYCPKCQTLEYSEIISTNGRLHKCNSKVVEQEVLIDITAEYTICKRNLFYIDKFQKSFLGYKVEKVEKKITKEEIKNFKIIIENLKYIELQMIHRLTKITKKQRLVAYDWNPENLKFLPITDINSMGLAVSDFRFKPEARFKKMGFCLEEINQDEDESPKNSDH